MKYRQGLFWLSIAVGAFVAPVAAEEPAGSSTVAPAAPAAAPAIVPPPSPAAVTDDPNAPHPSGIYLYHGARMTLVAPSIYEWRNFNPPGAEILLMDFAPPRKTEMGVIVQGTRAATRIAEQAPVFYFHTGDSAFSTPPGDFKLLRMEVKGDARSVVTVTDAPGLFDVSLAGPEANVDVPFASVEVQPGVYRVTINAALAPGEYAFLTVEMIGQRAADCRDLFGNIGSDCPEAKKMRLFDFGVDPSSGEAPHPSGTPVAAIPGQPANTTTGNPVEPAGNRVASLQPPQPVTRAIAGHWLGEAHCAWGSGAVGFDIQQSASGPVVTAMRSPGVGSFDKGSVSGDTISLIWSNWINTLTYTGKLASPGRFEGTFDVIMTGEKCMWYAVNQSPPPPAAAPATVSPPSAQ